MSSLLSDIAGAGAHTLELAVGFALGVSVGAALEPVAVGIRQESFSVEPNMALDADKAAGIVAEDVERTEWGIGEAAQTGVDEARFRALLGEALNAPPVAELLAMLRRDLIDTDAFAHGLRKAKLEPRWDAAVAGLRDVLLDPSVLALAVVRGLLDDQGLMPVSAAVGAGRVAAFPRQDIDAVQEAAAAGVSRERLAVMVGNMGRPAGPQEAARATFRGLIERVDFDRAIAEGDVRNEWRDVIFDVAREIPTARDYIEARLRGWLDTDAEMHAGTAKHGMSAADTNLLFRVSGRPLSFHQVWIGLQRGGEYDGPIDHLDPAFLKQLRESNIRPEWYNLAWSQRYTLPSAFVIRSLLKDGDLTPADAERLFIESGWPPDLAAKVAGTHPTTASTVGGHVKKAQGTAFTALHRAYVQGAADDEHARTIMDALGIPADEQTAVLAFWARERTLRRRLPTPTTIHREHAAGHLTTQTAIDELVAQGMSAADARAFLETTLPGGG